jgi:hypothetical protein
MAGTSSGAPRLAGFNRFAGKPHVVSEMETVECGHLINHHRIWRVRLSEQRRWAAYSKANNQRPLDLKNPRTNIFRKSPINCADLACGFKANGIPDVCVLVMN